MIQVSGNIEMNETSTIVLGMFQGEKKDSTQYKVMNKLLHGNYVSLLQKHQSWAKLGELNVIPVYDNNAVQFIMILGLGNGNNIDTSLYEELGLQVGKELLRRGITNTSVWWDSIYIGEEKTKNEYDSLSSFIKGYNGGYNTRYHSMKEVLTKSLTHTTYLYVNPKKVEFTKNVVHATQELLLTLEFVERLITSPPNIVTIQMFIEEIKQFSVRNKLEIDIFSKKDVNALGMGGILAFSKGDPDSAYFVKIQYKGDPSQDDYTTIIGAAVRNYHNQSPHRNKWKESNVVAATTALGILEIVARKELKINLSILLPIVDVDCKKIQNGDVIRLFNGKTVGIGNESFLEELLIVDSITFGLMENTNTIMNFSALTNELDYALGSSIRVAMTNHSMFKYNKEKSICFFSTDNKTLETVKRSSYADYCTNLGNRGRAIVKANFIGEFVKNVPWVHFDLGGFDRQHGERTIVKIVSVIGIAIDIVEEKAKLL
ncbi:M17 family peptidase N-terminal domain-containing protein [Evansella sp. AB-rgal1]|uniref:M17 family peptidase N-terminal domain-containing protein n=1 Tax=Evansella sp. AB-rgal1 TaxID=3242696 RepID=UPI00359D19B2